MERPTTIKITRKRNQSFQIEGGIIITVDYCTSGHVELSITAPKDTLILRSEIMDKSKKTFDQIKLERTKGAK